MTDRDDPLIRDAWNANHRFLLDVAYRMLGSVTDAEDVVQEAFARLVRNNPNDIDDVRAWLVVVVSRLCLDHLRSARVRREETAGPSMPEPLLASNDPADRITLDESVRMALLVVLEQLTPPERAAFVLHDVFGFSFDTVGTIVGRTPAACRQLASRARRHVQDNVGPARFMVAPEEHRALVDRFVAACTNGDIDALTALLDPSVEGIADIGPTRGQFFNTEAVGRDQVIERVLALFGPRSHITLARETVNGEAGVVARHGARVFAVIVLTARDGRIVEIQSIADPAKLRHVNQ
jgi:RNA polymerase sigma-70 factor (ECF subfamily)